MKKPAAFSVSVGMPDGLDHLRPGMQLVLVPIPRWYVRLWRWFLRTVLRRKQTPPPVDRRRITAIDFATRVVTYDGGEPLRAGQEVEVRH